MDFGHCEQSLRSSPGWLDKKLPIPVTAYLFDTFKTGWITWAPCPTIRSIESEERSLVITASCAAEIYDEYGSTQ